MNALLHASWLPTLGWVLLHSLWESTLVVLVAALVLRMLRGASSRLRYLLAVTALLVSAGLPLRHLVSVRPTPARILLVRAEAPPPDHSESASPSAVRTRLVGGLNSGLPWIVLCWVCGVLLSLVRLGGGWGLLQHLRWRKAHLAPDHLQGKLLSLCRKAGLRRAVTLLTCDGILGPSVVGVLRPAILVPSGWFLDLDPLYLEALLAHELAHVLRQDYVVNLLQSLIEVTMFYHPCVWWISRRIRAERELASDAFAVRLTGDAFPLAEALAHLERRGLDRASLEPALAAHGGSLMDRITQLLLPRRRTSSAPAFTSLAVLTFLLAAGMRVSAQAPHSLTAPPAIPVPSALPGGATVDAASVFFYLRTLPVLDPDGKAIPYRALLTIKANQVPLHQVWQAFDQAMRQMGQGHGTECWADRDGRARGGPINVDLDGAEPAMVVALLKRLAAEQGIEPYVDPDPMRFDVIYLMKSSADGDGRIRFALHARQVAPAFLDELLAAARKLTPGTAVTFARDRAEGPGPKVDAIFEKVSLEELEARVRAVQAKEAEDSSNHSGHSPGGASFEGVRGRVTGRIMR